MITGVVSLVLLALPIIQAHKVSSDVRGMFVEKSNSSTKIKSENNTAPFGFFQMITGINAKKISYETLTFDAGKALTLDFYRSTKRENKPCIIIVHGGSWAGGDSQQLPELNSELAKEGYNVASINYRLAPQYKYPAPIIDLKTALNFLRIQSSRLSIDTNNFVLLGRSAGGQIALSAAYTINDPAIKGVISFYGPADMVWGYANPTNPLVLNSRKVMEDYLGGTYSQVPQQYVNSSATETVSQHAVPTLLISGENDPLVSHLHAVRLGVQLDKIKMKHYDIYLPWATHGFDWTLNGPGGQISTWAVKRFLEQVVQQ